MSNYLTQGEADHQAWSGYWWPMMSSRDRPDYRNLYNENGPLDKYDRYCMALGLPNPRSRDFENWRNFADSRLEQASGYKAFWWGHCNGWAAASVLELEPSAAREVRGIRFGVGDQKGLLTVCHNGDPVDLIRRLGSDDAHVFHAAVLQSIGKDRRGLIFDTKLDPIDPETKKPVREVWNYPAYRYECSYTALGGDQYDVTMQLWFADDGVQPDFVGTRNWPEEDKPKVYTYRIRGDKANPRSGVWMGRSIGDHPDLVWRPQPLSVQNAAEERDPGSSQENHAQYFHPTLRSIVYTVTKDETISDFSKLKSKLASLDLHWVITEAEAAGYPPPINVGDFWRYRVVHKDTIGYTTRPFILHVEVVGYKGDDWVFEVGAVHQGDIIPERHVIYVDKKTRLISANAPCDNGYAYTLRQDIQTGAFNRSDDPSLWENSPLRPLLTQMPYAWDRAGLEPVTTIGLPGLGSEPVPSRVLSTGNGLQYWADHTVSHTRGNLRGMFLSAQLERVSAELIDFGQKVT